MNEHEKKILIEEAIAKMNSDIRVFEASFTVSSGLFFIDVKYEDFLLVIDKAKDGSIIIFNNHLIEDDDVDLSGRDELIGSVSSTSWYLRDGETNTWFAFRIEFIDTDFLNQNDDEEDYLDEVNMKKDYGHDFSMEKINNFSVQVASIDDFGGLKNKRERLDFARSFVFSKKERDELDIASSAIANSAEHVYEYHVFPNLVKKFSEEGKTIKEIAKLTGKSQRKVESSIDVVIPTFVSKIMASSIIYEKSLQIGSLPVDVVECLFFAQVLRKEKNKNDVSFEHVGDVNAVKIDGLIDMSDLFIFQLDAAIEGEEFSIFPNDIIYIWADDIGTVKIAFEVVRIECVTGKSPMLCQCVCIRRKDMDA